MQQYMIKTEQINNDFIDLDSDSWHHIKNVMRLNNNDEIICVDFQTQIRYLCQIMNGKVKIIKELLENNELPHNLVLACGLVKSVKLELIIQKACELGATKLILVQMERSIVKLDEKKLSSKLKRWQKIALEACEQAKRNTIMEIVGPIKLMELAHFKETKSFVAYENEKLINNLTNEIPLQHNVLVVVGPEGGISETEYQYLVDNDFISISLGKRILRCETAAIAALSNLAFLMEDFNEKICND